MDSELLNDYQEFVDEVSSDATKHTKDFIDSVEIIDEQGVEPSRLLTASIGLSGEVGEFNDMRTDDRIKEFENEQGDLIFECF